MPNVFPLYFEVDASGFAHSSPAEATTPMEFGSLKLDGIAGIALDANSNTIIGVADPVNNTDASNKQWTLNQIQAALTGLSWKTAVRAASKVALVDAYTYANGTLGVGATLTKTGFGAFPTLDGIAIPQYARVLIKDETATAKPYNGIYTLTTVGDVSHSWVLTRATDDDIIAEMLQATVAVDQGTQQDTTWVQSAHPTTMGTDDITWVAGPSITPYTASHGVKLVSSDFRFNPGDGLTLDGGSEPQYAQVSLYATNPGLQLIGTSPNKTLSAKADTAQGINLGANGIYLGLNGTNPGLAFTGTYVDTKLDTTGGIQTNSSGLALKLNGNTLVLTSTSGVSVAYAPDYQTTRTAGAGITKGMGVYYSGNNVVSAGDSSDLSKVGIVGVAKANITNGNPGQIAQDGDIVTGCLTSATAGTPYYLGHTGAPILGSALVAHDRAIMIGIAANATDMEVRIHDIGKK